MNCLKSMRLWLADMTGNVRHVGGKIGAAPIFDKA